METRRPSRPAPAAVAQHPAAALHHHPALGEPWLGRLHHPLDRLAWFGRHRAARPDVFLPAALWLYGALTAFLERPSPGSGGCCWRG